MLALVWSGCTAATLFAFKWLKVIFCRLQLQFWPSVTGFRAENKRRWKCTFLAFLSCYAGSLGVPLFQWVRRLSRSFVLFSSVLSQHIIAGENRLFTTRKLILCSYFFIFIFTSGMYTNCATIILSSAISIIRWFMKPQLFTLYLIASN